LGFGAVLESPRTGGTTGVGFNDENIGQYMALLYCERSM